MKDITHQDFSEDEATTSDDEADIEYERLLQKEVDQKREDLRLLKERNALVLAEVAIMDAEIEYMKKESATYDLEWIESVAGNPERQVAIDEAKKDAVWDMLSARVTASYAYLTVSNFILQKKKKPIVIEVNECKCCFLFFSVL
jgi:hypothetical protein